MNLVIIPKLGKHELWLISPGYRMPLGRHETTEEAKAGAREFARVMADEANRLSM